MTEQHPELDDLDARVRAAQARQAKNGKPDKPGSRVNVSQGLGLAFKLGIDMVAAVVIGVGIGWGLDKWLGTGPWLLLLFLILGMVAGIFNVFRSATGADAAVGLGRAARLRKERDAKGDNESKDG
ncbi:MAG: AtpZ/AtpI family protein [Alphaproteobacteria bacterium]